MKAFYPKFQVKLHNVFMGGREHDITDWFGEGCSIRTRKAYREPAGTFTLTLVDKKYDDASFYSKVAPMDAVEIRVAHDGRKDLKLLMRGFVSSVRRDEVMGQDGKPMRRVTIIGQDVGKLMLIHWIYFLPVAEELEYHLGAFGILRKYFGDAAKIFPANEFAQRFASILNEHLTTILGSTKLKGLTISSQANIKGTVTSPLSTPLTSSCYHQFMSFNLDVGTFNEMFLEDHEGGAHLIIRPVYTGESGITVDEEDVQSMSVFRTDASTANFFWFKQGFPLTDQTLAQVEAMRAGYIADARGDQWCRSEVFGLKKMEVMGQLYPPGFTNEDNPRKESVERRSTNITEWIAESVQTLRKNNHRNAHLEQGVIRVCGNEEARTATWITVKKSGKSYRYYAACVEHELQIYVSYSTTLHLERGEEVSGTDYRGELNLKGALK